MNRRTTLAALAAGATPFVLAASQRTLAQHTSSGTNTGAAGTTHETAAEHRRQTLMAGGFALQTSQIALQKAQSPRVKQFAQFEAAEQTTIAEVLTNSQTPTPPRLDAQQQQMMQELEQASGSAFDMQYIQGQIQGHRQLLQIQQAFIQSQRDMKSGDIHVAMMARTMIQEHLTLLQEISSSMHT